MPFLAMELLEGQDLQRALREGKLAGPAQALRVIAEVLDALGHAHARGIVHRDMKPSNVFLHADTHAKILDFGVARLGEGMTVTGRVVGTPHYMSPEQIRADPVDGRSDLFSTALMFYEMVTGAKAYRPGSAVTIMYQIVHEDADLSRLPDTPAGAALLAVLTARSRARPERPLPERRRPGHRAHPGRARARGRAPRAHGRRRSPRSWHAWRSCRSPRRPERRDPTWTCPSRLRREATMRRRRRPRAEGCSPRRSWFPASRPAARSGGGRRGRPRSARVPSRPRWDRCPCALPGARPRPRSRRARPRPRLRPRVSSTLERRPRCLRPRQHLPTTLSIAPSPPPGSVNASPPPITLASAPSPTTPQSRPARPTVARPMDAQSRLDRADQLFQAGRLREALGEVRAVLREDPGNTEAKYLAEDIELDLAVEDHLRKARAALARGDRDAARREAEAGLRVQAQRIAPHRPPATARAALTRPRRPSTPASEARRLRTRTRHCSASAAASTTLQ